MKKVLGFALLMLAIGMFFMLILPDGIGLIVMLICLVVGYQFFSAC